MFDLYTQALTLLQRWPGIGPSASHRLLEFFLQDAQKNKTLHKLGNLMTIFKQCQKCHLYHAVTSECTNCLQSNTTTIMIITSPVDYFFCQQHHFFKKHRFFCLNGYVSPHQGKTLDNTNLNDIIDQLKYIPPQKLYLLFNQSLEARATTWLLRKNISEIHQIYECASLLREKEALHYLTSHDRDQYIESLSNLMNQA
jgi:recombinational DNA repair protein RecR